MSDKPKSAVISTRALSKNYEDAGQCIEVLHNIEFSLNKGERLAIIGSSGAGKSTLLNMLGGLDVPSSGEVIVAGKNMADCNDHERSQWRNQHLGFVYQFHHLLGEFSAEENVAMPLLIAGEGRARALARAREMLSVIGLEHRVQHRPAELSGGERQRVAIARAIVSHPDCVLMDEPTGNLDEKTARTIEDLFLELNQTLHISFILVTHDTRLAFAMDRVLELKAGKLFVAEMVE